MTDDERLQPQSWGRKFRCAFRGVKRGFRGECSFFVHGFATVAVVLAALALEADRYEWYVLLFCITLVLTAEMFNSSIERLARAVSDEFHPQLRDALDIAGGAVLTASLGAATVGTLVLGRLALRMLGAIG
ncbi:MAG: diacylglycerol kinase [Pirellula sp.]|nr:diacylglycerol kinase [Pirellula sp.]